MPYLCTVCDRTLLPVGDKPHDGMSESQFERLEYSDYFCRHCPRDANEDLRHFREIDLKHWQVETVVCYNCPDVLLVRKEKPWLLNMPGEITFTCPQCISKNYFSYEEWLHPDYPPNVMMCEYIVKRLKECQGGTIYSHYARLLAHLLRHEPSVEVNCKYNFGLSSVWCARAGMYFGGSALIYRYRRVGTAAPWNLMTTLDSYDAQKILARLSQTLGTDYARQIYQEDDSWLSSMPLSCASAPPSQSLESAS